jgi:hypothetical protein
MALAFFLAAGREEPTPCPTLLFVSILLYIELFGFLFTFFFISIWAGLINDSGKSHSPAGLWGVVEWHVT